MINEVIRALRLLRYEPSSLELADALWLATRLPAVPRPAEVPVKVAKTPKASEADPTDAAPAPALTDKPPAPAPVPVVPGPDNHLTAAGELPLRVPAPPALPESLLLGRALQSFKRRVPSRHRFELDEAATVDAIATTGLWTPVMRPARARWLDVALVVDGARSMVIWRRVVTALARLLRYHGAFQRVAVWTLVTDAPGGALSLHAGPDARGPRRADQALSSPADRTLLLLVSDCTSVGWHGGQVNDWIRTRAAHAPLAVVQVLPARAWSRTALRRSREGWFQNGEPGAPGALWRGVGSDGTAKRARAPGRKAARPNEAVPGGGVDAPDLRDLPLPVFALDPPSIEPWARVVAGHPAARAGGVWLPSSKRHAERAREMAENTTPAEVGAAERVARFEHASPGAVPLARLLATVPLVFPVMRMVMATCLPEARLPDLAEVLYGGLTRMKTTLEQAGWNPDAVTFEFHDGVREKLLEALPSWQIAAIWETATRFFAGAEETGDFVAWVSRDQKASPLQQAFASIAPSVLEGLGGRYEELARATNVDPPIDFVIITALEELREAVRSKLIDVRKLDRDSTDTHTYYEGWIKTKRSDEAVYRVILTSLSSMGPIKGAIKASAVIKRWDPAHVLMVGIAGGIAGEVELGDVIVASQVSDYTVGKVHETGKREERWVTYPADANLLDGAMNFPDGWEDLIRHERPAPGAPKRRAGVVASGGDVIASKEQIDAYLNDWSKLVGVEMEGGGVAAGLHDDIARPRFLMIRGVSDLANGENNAETKRAWRTYACHVAAAYAIGLLRDGPVPGSHSVAGPPALPIPETPAATPAPAPRVPSTVGALTWEGLAAAAPTYQVNSFDDLVLCMHPDAERAWPEFVPNAGRGDLTCVTIQTPAGPWHRETLDAPAWKSVYERIEAAVQEARRAKPKRIHLVAMAPYSLGALLGARLDAHNHDLVVYQPDNKEGSKDQKIWRPWGPAWPANPGSRTESFFDVPPEIAQPRPEEDGDIAIVVDVTGWSDPKSCLAGVRAHKSHRPARPVLIRARGTHQGAIGAPADVDKAAGELERLLQDTAEALPNATLHLFYYGPLALLIRASRGLRLRRTPIIVYEAIYPDGKLQWTPAVAFPEGRLLIEQGATPGVAAAVAAQALPAGEAPPPPAVSAGRAASAGAQGGKVAVPASVVATRSLPPGFAFPPPLVKAYKRGELAVLFGSGLSMARDVKGDFPRWNDLPDRLLDQTVNQGVWPKQQADAMRGFFKSGYVSLEGMLTALDMIKQPLRGARKYRQALTALFRPKSAAPGDVHRALVDLGVNVLSTTNYDELLEAVEGPPRRRVFSWKESDKALDDVNAGEKILFKIHGNAEDDDSIVMTRAEYDTAAKDLHYQRTMSFLLQRYTFLLVGYGINDPLDLDLLFELNTNAFGSAAQLHYALVKDAAPTDRDRWQRDMNVQVVPYADHADLPAILTALRTHP